jgi:hypothetical protein
MWKSYGLIAVVVAGLGLALVAVDRVVTYERAAERRSLEMRASELTARALVPGSPLACLDGAAGEGVETACERILFARPETVAAAVSYMAAGIDLLSDGAAFARRRDAEFDRKLAGLRRAIGLDRFGIAAHVLATRDGCSADRCTVFEWLTDAGTLKSNLRSDIFAQYVERYRADWQNQQPGSPPAETSGAPVGSVSSSGAVPGAHATDFDFPSAASIPPVSIMDPEPKAAAKQEAASGVAPANDRKPSAPPVPPRRPQNQAAGPAAR